MLALIDHLIEDVKRYNQEISALKKILQTAEHQVLIMGEHSRTASVRDRIKSAILDLETYKQETEQKIEKYSEISRTSEIQIMYFQAVHGSIRSDEWKEINESIRAFSANPFLNEVNSNMSDEVVVYTGEEVDDEEAQAIWDYLNEFMFTDDDDDDDDGTGIRFQPGEMFYWNGKKVSKKNKNAK